jgi:hypothetical protein
MTYQVSEQSETNEDLLSRTKSASIFLFLIGFCSANLSYNFVQWFLLIILFRQGWPRQHQVRGLRDFGLAQRLLLLRHVQRLHGWKGIYPGKHFRINKNIVNKNHSP